MKVDSSDLRIATIDAALFDLDGTIVHNMPFHQKAWFEFAAAKGLPLSEEDFKHKVFGRQNEVIFRSLYGDRLTPVEILQLAAEKEAVYRKLYHPHVREVEGLSALLEKLKAAGKKLGIVTLAPKENCDFILGLLPAAAHFEILVGEKDVQRGKPDPEAYLKAAAMLGVSPARTVVFEDSPVGVRAGHAAGMRVVGISTTHSAKELAEAEAVIENFVQIRVL